MNLEREESAVCARKSSLMWTCLRDIEKIEYTDSCIDHRQKMCVNNVVCV